MTTDKGDWEGDLVLLAIGVRPDTRLAKSIGFKIGKTGAIAVNFAQQTSLENVYAAGDCCESFHGQPPLGKYSAGRYRQQTGTRRRTQYRRQTADL